MLLVFYISKISVLFRKVYTVLCKFLQVFKHTFHRTGHFLVFFMKELNLFYDKKKFVFVFITVIFLLFLVTWFAAVETLCTSFFGQFCFLFMPSVYLIKLDALAHAVYVDGEDGQGGEDDEDNGHTCLLYTHAGRFLLMTYVHLK